MHVNKADFKGGKISRPVVPFMPQQLLWQKDDMTFIKALATFISHDIEFFLKAEFQRVFFITISLVFLNSSYGYFLRSCIIKVIKSFVHLYNFFLSLGTCTVGRIASLKAIADIKTNFKIALTFCSTAPPVIEHIQIAISISVGRKIH